MSYLWRFKEKLYEKRGYYYLKTGTYYCFNCDTNVTGLKLLETLCGTDYNELRDEYFRKVYDGKHFGSLSSDVYKVKTLESSIFNVKSIVKKEWKHELSENAKTYLNNRKVLEAPFLKDKLYTYYDKKNNEYILIPWKLNDVEYYFQINDFQKHNTSGMKYIFPKNKDKMIAGLDNIDVSFPYIICFEGFYDSVFVKNGVCLGGKNLTNIQYDIIKRRFPNHKIVIALDNDKPGLEATAKLLKDDNRKNEISFFKLFSDDTKEKDINDFIISKNNVNLFADKKVIESSIIDPLIMKMWLIKKGFI